MLRINDVSYVYPEGIPALKNVSLNILPGEFVILSGSNGGGKSTLLRAIMGFMEEYFQGTLSGEILLEGKPISSYGTAGVVGKMGIVLQDPESQICNLTVWEEVTSALCNLLYPKEDVIIRGTEELLRMNLENLGGLSVDTLSGGQLQRLAIASLLALRPKILIFDEPLANLDPLGVASFVDALKIVKNYVDIIIVASHWLDPFLNLATRAILFENGEVVLDCRTSELRTHVSDFVRYNVEVPQVYLIEEVLKKQGVSVVSQNGTIHLPHGISIRPVKPSLTDSLRPLISFRNLDYVYPDGTVSLTSVTASIKSGVRTALIGHNGAGKSTLARIAANLRKPTSGIVINGSQKVSLMPQKPSLGFIANTVLDELRFGTNLSDLEAEKILREADLWRYRDISPFNLSGGEQRRLSLAAALASHPDLLLMDEPTAGLDSKQVQRVENQLANFGGTVILITHDPRIVGSFVTNVLVLDKGKVAYDGATGNISAELLYDLGYSSINPTVALATQTLKVGIPMIPSQLEVSNAAGV